MKKRCLIFLIFIANILTINAQVKNIPLYKNLAYKESKISEYASAIKYVPLETKRECLLNEELQIIATSQFIFVHDFLADRVYRFDANSGKFLNTIGKKGQGPGEYKRLFGIYVDDARKKCFLMDSYDGQTYVYDYDGKFDSVFSGKYAANRMMKMGNNYVVNNMLYLQSKNEMFLINDKGKVLRKADFPDNEKYGMLLWAPYFFNHDGKLYYKNYISEYIYAIDNSLNKNPAYYVDCGKRAINPRDDQYRLDKGSVVKETALVVGEIKAYKDNLYIPYCTDKRSFAVYNIKTGQTFSPGKDGKSGFTDDISNGPLVEVVYSSYLFDSCVPNQLVSAIYLSKIEDEKFKPGAFKKIMDRLDIDSNPVVRIITLK